MAGVLGLGKSAVDGGDGFEVAVEEPEAALGDFGVRVSDMFDDLSDVFLLCELRLGEGKIGAGRGKERHEVRGVVGLGRGEGPEGFAGARRRGWE